MPPCYCYCWLIFLKYHHSHSSRSKILLILLLVTNGCWLSVLFADLPKCWPLLELSLSTLLFPITHSPWRTSSLPYLVVTLNSLLPSYSSRHAPNLHLQLSTWMSRRCFIVLLSKIQLTLSPLKLFLPPDFTILVTGTSIAAQNRQTHRSFPFPDTTI